MKEKDINSLDHTSWRCQYHVVFAPKYRRMAIYKEIKTDIGKILRQLCQQKGVDIIEAELCPDHVHMLLSIEVGICTHAMYYQRLLIPLGYFYLFYENVFLYFNVDVTRSVDAAFSYGFEKLRI